MPARSVVLDGDTTPLLITDRPVGDGCDPLPEGRSPDRAQVVRARQVQVGDLLVGDFAPLIPAVDDENPCEVYAINAPVLIIQAADRPPNNRARR